MAEPFHEGEVAVQERTGERAMAVRNASLISERIIPNARPFLSAQRMLVVGGSVGDEIWASIWFGAAGFVRSEDEGAIVCIDASHGLTSLEDPLRGQFLEGRSVSLLAIDLATRKRLRINGVVSECASEIRIRVRESFPQCPKYIQRREPPPSSLVAPSRAIFGERLDAERMAFARGVDTAFVASRHARRGVAVSHRGGAPGFVRVVDDRTLRFPEYPGNSMFQTLGNISIDPTAGLVLADLEGGRLLALTGRAEASFGVEDPSHPTKGTDRYWTFTITRWIETSLPAAEGWELRERSRFNPPASAP